MCQSHSTVRTNCRITCTNTPSHSRPEPSWSDRHSQYGSSSSLPRRYTTYRPLNMYWSQYGSNLQRANQTISATNAYQQSGSRSYATAGEQHALGHYSSHHLGLNGNSDRKGAEETAHSTSHIYQMSLTHRPETQQRKMEKGTLVHHTHFSPETHQRMASTHSYSSSTIPPLTESSSGLTHYGTLRGHGQERRRGRHGRVRGPGGSLSSQGRRYRGSKRQRVPGEGFGEAYLRWSEYGVGKTKKWIVI